MNNISTRIGRVVKPTYKILAKNVIPQKPQKQAKPQKPQKQAKPQKTPIQSNLGVLPVIILPDNVPNPVIDTSMLSKEEIGDFYVETNPFYVENFFTPRDNITKRYDDVDTLIGDRLD